MRKTIVTFTALIGFLLASVAAYAQALRVEITEGVIEPMPFAAPNFGANGDAARAVADQVNAVVVNDLVGSGLFREIPKSAHISGISDFNAAIQLARF